MCQNLLSHCDASHCWAPPQEESDNLPGLFGKKNHAKLGFRRDLSALTLRRRRDVGDAEVWTGHRRRAHVLPQSWDLRQGEDDFIAVLSL